MRPASSFLFIQLSNARARRQQAFADDFKLRDENRLEDFWRFPADGKYGIIPSLTVEKKNECHNP